MANPATATLAAVGIIYAAVVALWPFLPSRTRWLRQGAIVVAMAVVLLAGFLLPADARLFRAGVAVLGMLVALRIYSYQRAERHLGFADYLRFISLGLWQPYLIYSAAGHPLPAPVSVGRELFRIGCGSTIILLAWPAAKHLILAPVGHSWAVNHLVLMGAFVVIMDSFGRICGAIWRLRGLGAKPLIDHIFLSRTPADFWRRWSWPIHTWLYRYVYVPTGGRGTCFWPTFTVFFLSGLQHEYMAAVALGRVTGHQMTFFLLNGLGVGASPWLERLSRWGLCGEILLRGITFAFLILTATLMFTTLHYLFALYYRPNGLMW